MKASRQTNKKVIKVPVECKASKGSRMREPKSTRRTTPHCYKETGNAADLLVGKDMPLPSSSAADGMCVERRNRGVHFPETTKGQPILGLCQGQTLLPDSKIKLQLFPVNESTRIGLEKDGHHPYLELILRARKKISSILKHLNRKWGNSSIALGEPVLFPYQIQEKFSGNRRWTLTDGDISAGAVYATIGSPAVFRLRYGWFTTEPKTCGELPTSANARVDLQSEGTQSDSSAAIYNAYDEVGKATVLTRKDIRPINACEAGTAGTEKIDSNELITEKISTGTINLKRTRMVDGNHAQSSALFSDNMTNFSIGGLLSEVSLQAKCNNIVTNQIKGEKGFHPIETKSDLKSVWADWTSISFGALLSEASLQGKLNRSDAQSVRSNAGLQTTRLISDPHQAFIAAQKNSSQGPQTSGQVSCLSILDAEETCHAFPSKKFFSSRKDVLGLDGSCGSFSQNAGSKVFKLPNPAKQVNSLAELPPDRARQESGPDHMICSRLQNDERSLGLSGIKWTDSLGPFDLGMPVSQKLITGESKSISGFVK